MDSRGSSRPSSRQSCQSTASRHPQSTAELLAYVNKANQTIRLLQEELHTTSQFAIKLTQKYEAKRAERDQVLQQLQRQQRQSHKQMCQLQLLCNYLAQDRQPREMPAAVAAVVVEHATLSSGDIQHAGQLSAASAAKTAEQQQRNTPRKVHAAGATTTKQAQQPAQQPTCNPPASGQAAGAVAVMYVASPGAQAAASSDAAAATSCPDTAVHTLSSSPRRHGAVQIQQAGTSSARTRDGGSTSGASQSSSMPSRAPSTCLPGAAVEEAAAAGASSSHGPGWMAALQSNSSHKNGKQQLQPQQQQSQEQKQVQQRKHPQLAYAPTSMAAAADESDHVNSVAAAPQQRTRPLVTSRPDSTPVTGQHSGPPASSRFHSKPCECDTAAGSTREPSAVVPVAPAKDGTSPASDHNSSGSSSSCSGDATTHSSGADSSGDLGRSEGNASKTYDPAPVEHPAGSVSSTAQTGTGTSSINSSRSASCQSEQASCGAGSSRSRSRPHSSRVHEHLQHSSGSDTVSQRSATRPAKCQAKAGLVCNPDNTGSTTQFDASSPAPQEINKQQDSTSTSPRRQSHHSPAPVAAEITCAASPQPASQTGASQLAAASQQRTSSVSPRQPSRWFSESASVVQATEPSSPDSPSLASPCSSGFQSVASIGQDRNSSCRSSFSSMVSACSRSTRASQGSLSAAVSSAWIEPDETPNSIAAAASVCRKVSADASSGCCRASRPSSRSERHATSPMTSPDTGRSNWEHSAGDAAASTAARERQSPASCLNPRRSQHRTKGAASESSAELRSNSSSPKPGRQSRRGKIIAASSCSPYRSAPAAATADDNPESPCDSTAVRGSVQQQQQQQKADGQQQQPPAADVSGSGATTYSSSSQQVLTRSSSEAAGLLGLVGDTFSNVRAAAAAVVGALPSAGFTHTTGGGSAAAWGASSSNSWSLIRTLSKQDATETAAAQQSMVEREAHQLDTSVAATCKEAVGPADTSGNDEDQESSSSSCEDDFGSSSSTASSSSSSDNDIRNGSPTETCRPATAVVESSRAAAASCSFSTWNTAKSAGQAGAQLQQQQQQSGLPHLHDSMLGGFHARNTQPGQGGAVRGRRRAAAAVRRGHANRQQQIGTMQLQSQFVFGQADGKFDDVGMTVGQVGVAVGAPVHLSSGCAVGSSGGERDANQDASAVVQSGTAGAAVGARPARMPRRVPELRRCFEPPAPKDSSTHEHGSRSHSRCSSSGSSSSSGSEEESGSDDDESFADAEEGSSTHGSSSAAGGNSRNSSRGGVTPEEPLPVSATAGVAATPGTVSRSNSFGLSLGGLLTSLAAVGGAAAAAMSDRLSPGRSKSRPGRPPWASSGGVGERTAATSSNDCRQASSSTPGAAAAPLVSRGPTAGRSALGSPARHSSPVAAATAADPAANLPSDLNDDSSSSGGRAVARPPDSNCGSDVDSGDSDPGSSEGESGDTGSNAVASPAATDGEGSSSESDDDSEDESHSDEVSAGSTNSSNSISEVNDDHGTTGRNPFDLLQCSEDSEIQQDSLSEDTSENME